MSKSHYEIVGAPATSTPEQLRRAYLKRARQLHPDQFAGRPAAERAKAERRMQELNASWTVLSDPEARRAYDLRLRRPAPRGTGRVVSAREGAWKPFDPSEPPRPKPRKGPVVADEREMEIRGTAKLLRPAPVAIMVGMFVLFIVAATMLTGGGGDTTPARTAPEAQPTGVPLECLSLGALTEVTRCDGRHDAVVWSVVDAGEACPDGQDSIYRQGLGGLYCITRVE